MNIDRATAAQTLLKRQKLQNGPPVRSSELVRRPELVNRITAYLCVGGLVNPEMMEHDKVRDLLTDVRDYLLADSSPNTQAQPRAGQQ